MLLTVCVRDATGLAGRSWVTWVRDRLGRDEEDLAQALVCSFLFFLFFHIFKFKPVSIICFKFQISILKHNPNVNINHTISNAIIYSSSHYLILEVINDFITSFFPHFIFKFII